MEAWEKIEREQPVKLKAHRARGKDCGFYVYLSRAQVADAMGIPESEVSGSMSAVRLVLDPGTKQILIRLKETSK